MSTQGRLRIFTAVVAAAVVAAIVAGLVVLGSPAEQRRLRLDERRVRDLNAIVGEITAHWRTKSRLPATLGELGGGAGTVRHSDPVTALEYEYRPIEGKEFELCAVFETESRSEAPRWSMFDRIWVHGRGRQCFQLSTDYDQ
jgi:hypothetical protein